MKKILLAFSIFIIFCILAGCAEKTEDPENDTLGNNCEAFIIMSSGEYSLSFDIDGQTISLCQKGEKVTLIAGKKEDALQILLQKDGKYVVDPKEKKYYDYIATEITYDWLFFKRSNYTFKSVEKSNDEEIYCYARGKAILEYHYIEKKLAKIIWNIQNPNVPNIELDIISLKNSVPDSILFEIPKDYVKTS